MYGPWSRYWPQFHRDRVSPQQITDDFFNLQRKDLKRTRRSLKPNKTYASLTFMWYIPHSQTRLWTLSDASVSIIYI